MSRSLPSFEHENAFSMFDSEQVVEFQDQGAKYWVFQSPFFILNSLKFPFISLGVLKYYYSDSGREVGQGKFVKNVKRRVLKKRRAWKI